MVIVEKEWEKFRDVVMECTNDFCSIMRRVGGQRRNENEWWNKELNVTLAKNR